MGQRSGGWAARDDWFTGVGLGGCRTRRCHSCLDSSRRRHSSMLRNRVHDARTESLRAVTPPARSDVVAGRKCASRGAPGNSSGQGAPRGPHGPGGHCRASHSSMKWASVPLKRLTGGIEPVLFIAVHRCHAASFDCRSIRALTMKSPSSFNEGQYQIYTHLPSLAKASVLGSSNRLRNGCPKTANTHTAAVTHASTLRTIASEHQTAQGLLRIASEP